MVLVVHGALCVACSADAKSVEKDASSVTGGFADIDASTSTGGTAVQDGSTNTGGVQRDGGRVDNNASGGNDADGGSGLDASADFPQRNFEMIGFALQGTPDSQLITWHNTGADGCTIEGVSGCEIERCPVNPTETSAPDTGEVSITGDVGTMVASPDMSGFYLSSNTSEAIWKLGPIHFSSPGNGLPPLDVTLPAPALWAPPVNIPTTIDLSQDLSIFYDGRGAGTVLVAIGANLQGTDSASDLWIRCYNDSARTQIVIPKEVLSRFTSGTSVTVALTTESRKVISVSDTFEIRVSVRSTLAYATASVL